MDAKKPTFIVDLEADKEVKPLPYRLPKKRRKGMFGVDFYPKYEVEFFDVVKDCAAYIDRVGHIDEKIRFTNRLNRIFIERDRRSAMRLFRDLVNVVIKGGDSHG